MKRIVCGIAVLAGGALALSAAGSALAGLPAPTQVTVEPAPGENRYDPSRVELEIRGDAPPSVVEWRWGPGGSGSEAPHDVDHRGGLFRTNLRKTGTFARTFSAGTFRYFCSIHAEMTGVVAAEPVHEVADGARLFRVHWASTESNTGDVYDVRYRVGERRWRTWKTDTRQTSAMFGRRGRPESVRCGRRYSFQARSQKAGKPRRRSAWSPVHTYVACD